MILSLLLSVAPIAEAATKADVKSALDYMFCRKASVRGCTRPIFKSDWAMSDVSPVHRLVIVHEGKRYTLQHSAGYTRSYDQQYDPPAFEIYERVEGSKGAYVVYSDDGLNGTVDFGGGGGSRDKSFWDHSEGDPSLRDYPVEGEEYRAYWQRKYDAAIAAILEYYNTPVAPEPAPTSDSTAQTEVPTAPPVDSVVPTPQ